MSIKTESVHTDYFRAFERSEEPFLFYYAFGDDDGGISRTQWTRGEFWTLAKKAASVIRGRGLGVGECFAECFGGNHPADLVFRLAAVFTGAVPVTINWQADTLDRILYKIERTDTKLLVTGSHFDPVYVESIQKRFPQIPVFDVGFLADQEEIPEEAFSTELHGESTRLIVFTSGTTGQPKGVKLPYRAYQTNRSTFERFLEVDPGSRFAVLVVNPLHHSNSSSITDWAMRRPGSHIHLIEKYSTGYWKILAEVASRNYDRLVAPTVSRHFDFLAGLDSQNKLPVEPDRLKEAMGRTDFLIGSAPVGPTTIRRLQEYAGRIPNVRFGSTETCLQVIGIPRSLPEKVKFQAFQRGWERLKNGELQPGYYIGRPHPPYTEVRIVKSVTPRIEGFMEDCDLDESGYLVTRGENLLSEYVKDHEATREVMQEGWYTGLKDICFALENESDADLDYYWVSRESTLLIRGGANYAYDQIESELVEFVSRQYGLSRDSFDLAVVGLRVHSEHEDSCCVTIEARDEKARGKREEIHNTFKEEASKRVSKGAKPDYLRFGGIPRNFKGAILTRQLAAEFKMWLEEQTEN